MRNQDNILLTLRNKLFDKPTPLQKKAYMEAAPLLFPDQSSVIRFLEAKSQEETTRFAKDVINSLISESAFSPPLYVLHNLLSFEDRFPYTQEASASTFIPRDHFVHLVHLYLFGIYVFAYHSELNKLCTSSLNSMKREFCRNHKLSYSDYLSRLNHYQAFAVYWRYFVLFHDLGYPLERVPASLRKNYDEKGFKPFKRLVKSFYRDLSIKILARIVVLKHLLGKKENTFEREFGKLSAPVFHLRRKDEGKTITRGNKTIKISPPWKLSKRQDLSLTPKAIDKLNDKWAGAVSLNYHGDASSIKLVRSTFSDEDVCAVLEDSHGGEPILLLTRKHGVFWGCRLRKSERGLSFLRRNMIDELGRMAFSLGESPRPGLEWRFFVLNPSKRLEDIIDRTIRYAAEVNTENAVDQSFLDQISRHIHATDHFLRREIHSGRVSRALTFVAFQSLAAALEYISEGGSHLEEYVGDRIHSYEQIASKVPRMIGDNICELLTQGDFDIESELRDITKSTDQVIAALIKALWKKKEEVETRVINSVAPEIEKQILFKQRSRRLKNTVRATLIGRKVEEEEDRFNPFNGISIGAGFSLKDVNIPWPEGFNYLDSELEKLGWPTSTWLFSSYVPEHLIKENRRLQRDDEVFNEHVLVDHGLCSALAMNIIGAVSSNIIQKLSGDDPPELTLVPELLRIGFEVPSSGDEDFLDLAREYFFSSAMSAVALHNLYPQYFEEGLRGRKVGMKEAPLTYLAMLCDGLQQWDRKRGIDLSKKDLPFSHYASRFSVQIDGSRIDVRVAGLDVDPIREEMTLRKDLGRYLAGADALITVSVIHG